MDIDNGDFLAIVHVLRETNLIQFDLFLMRGAQLSINFEGVIGKCKKPLEEKEAMGKYAVLRSYMHKFKNMKAVHVPKDCSLVIEGDSFIRQQYKESGLNFTLGGEYDKYADYLKTVLNVFIENNVTCYVVFTGAMEVNMEKRNEIYQNIVDNRDTIEWGHRSDTFFNPIFTKNVKREVLEELGIWYCVTEYAARQTLLDLSRELNCPVLTYHFEQCLLGMSCLIPISNPNPEARRHIKYILLTPDSFNEHIRIFEDMKPLFFTMLDENLSVFNKIPEIIGCKNYSIATLLYWMRKQKRESLESIIDKLEMLLTTTVEKELFRASINELTNLFFYKKESSALKYLKGEQTGVLNNKQEQFRNGVMTGKIPNVYINLKNKGTFSGSWVVFDESKRDAMLPTLDIVMYAHSLLWDSPRSLHFVGRKGRCVDVTVMPPKYSGISKNGKKEEGEFEKFIEDILPGFDWSLLKPVPEDCWLLIVGLVYYFSKADRDFTAEAYSILLSYVMLGPVSEKVGLIRKDKIKLCSLESGGKDDGICTYKDCLEVAKAMVYYFEEGDIKKTFDRGVLHDLAEFQHCLQHVNYLNELCGQIKGTKYYKTYNGTFVINILLQLKKYDDPMLFFDRNFNASSSVLCFYKRVKEIFDNLLSVTNLK